MRLGIRVLFPYALILTLPVYGATPDTRITPQSPQATQTAEQYGTQPPISTLKVFTRETIVDIIVTDSKGQPIRDLKSSDFALQEDGKPQSIRSFLESSFAATQDRKNPRLPAGVHTNFQSTPANGPVNVILIDALHSDFTGAARSLEATARYVSTMPPATQVAILWLSTSGLHTLQGFTSDRKLLFAATQVTRTDIGSNEDCHTIDWTTVDALNQIANYVAPIKGRKNLLWLTSGMPVYLLRDGGYGWGRTSSCSDSRVNRYATDYLNTDDLYRNNPYSEASERGLFVVPNAFGASINAFGASNGEGLNLGLAHRLMDTYELFTVEQIAVSPVDVHGLTPGRNALGTPQLVAEQVAQQSGGIAQYNSNDLAGRLAQAIDLGSHYYSVSYVPPRHKDDGHYHTIKVSVDIPGAKLVYREGYNAEDPRQPREYKGPELIKAALQGKTPPATQILFDAKLQPVPEDPYNLGTRPQPGTKSKKAPARTPYDLFLAVPQSQITYHEGPNDTHSVNLQFAFDAYDLNGKFLGSHSQNVSLNLPPDRYESFRKSPVVFHEQIAFFPGPLFLRVGVLDGVSNKVGTLEIPLTVPKK
jgi:VWFA-related protein